MLERAAKKGDPKLRETITLQILAVPTHPTDVCERGREREGEKARETVERRDGEGDPDLIRTSFMKTPSRGSPTRFASKITTNYFSS